MTKTIALCLSDPALTCSPRSVKSLLRGTSLILVTASQLALTATLVQAQSSDDIDIGSPHYAGSTSYHTNFSLSGTTSVTQAIYTVSGGGSDIWNNSDHFHFNRGPLTGNGTVSAQVLSIGNTNSWAKSGVMLRNDTTASSAYAAIYVTPGNGVSFQWRASAGVNANFVQQQGVTAPVWLKLHRSANSVSAYYSKDGSSWTQLGSAKSVALGNVALAGVAVTAHNDSALCTSTLANVLATPDVDSRYLHAFGNKVVNASGAVVNLRGTNLGGWLVTEDWMTGDASGVGRFALETLESRFGVAQAGVLINAWRDNWINANDLDNIKSYGFTAVRVPFSWRNLQDASGNWILSPQGTIDFSRFDWTVQEAAKRGLYVIFDFHVWEGQQAGYGDICQGQDPGSAETAEGAAIWSQLAAHFAGNGTVAAFDLINEPTGSNNFYQAHRAFYSAIRAQDPNRLVIAEWVNAFDTPALGWSNFMLSDHYNNQDLPSFGTWMNNILTASGDASLSIPFFEGEFKPQDASAPWLQQNCIDLTVAMDQLNWAWTTWCYKGVNNGGWALTNYDTSLSYNVQTSSYDTLLTQFTSVLTQWCTTGQANNLWPYTQYIAGMSYGATYVVPTNLPIASPTITALINSSSGLAADDAGGSTAQNVQIVQSTINSGASQNWVVNCLSNGNWAFINTASALALGSTSASDAAIQSSWTNSSTQQWTLTANGDGSYQLVNVANGLALDDSGASNASGNPLILWPGSSAVNQKWTFQNEMPLIANHAYKFVPECAPGSALEVSGASTSAGANVDIWAATGSANQSWIAVGDQNGVWEFAPMQATDMRMDVFAAGTANNTNVGQWYAGGAINQKWRLYRNADGSYSLEPQNAPGMRLDVYGAGSANGTNVEIWSANGFSQQAWRIYAQ